MVATHGQYYKAIHEYDGGNKVCVNVAAVWWYMEHVGESVSQVGGPAFAHDSGSAPLTFPSEETPGC